MRQQDIIEDLHDRLGVGNICCSSLQMTYLPSIPISRGNVSPFPTLFLPHRLTSFLIFCAVPKQPSSQPRSHVCVSEGISPTRIAARRQSASSSVCQAPGHKLYA